MVQEDARRDRAGSGEPPVRPDPVNAGPCNPEKAVGKLALIGKIA